MHTARTRTHIDRASTHNPHQSTRQVQDRRQSRVRLLRACPRTGRSHLLLEERALEGLWVNLHHLFRSV